MNDKVRQYIADLRGTSLHPLMEEVLDLAERAMELEADKKRLDWMERVVFYFLDSTLTVDGHSRYRTLREAIDAAKEGV